MASVEDLPEDLVPLGRIIPPLTVALMEPGELYLRCVYAAQLTGLAELSDESEAKRLRRTARRHLEAISVTALSQECERLQEKSREAALNNDERTAAYWLDQLADLVRDNPQQPEEWLNSVRAAEVVRSADRAKENSAARPRRFRFRLRKDS